jgi:serine phosphatase RsbU (regulator of sigma subunit)
MEASSSDELLRTAHPAALVSLDGVLCRLNDAMASALGRPAKQCLGCTFAELLAADQRGPAEHLVAQAATGRRAAMSVLEFPGSGDASLMRVRAQQGRLDLAMAVQKSMLPALPPDVPGLEIAARYVPSRSGLDIGGDWYDVFRLTDGAVALAIGDVQGHDVEAAAWMGRLRTIMRTLTSEQLGPGGALARVDKVLNRDDADRFASRTLLRIDPGNGHVIGTSAGHVPVLCAFKDGGHIVRRLPGGPVLGVVPDVDYPLGTFSLDRDSVLVTLTDGLVEGPNLTLEDGLRQVGELAAGALLEGLSAEAIADRILEAADAVGHADDVAMLVVRRA